MADVIFREGFKMLTVADMGGGRVKNDQKSADVLYGRSQRLFVMSSFGFDTSM